MKKTPVVCNYNILILLSTISVRFDRLTCIHIYALKLKTNKTKCMNNHENTNHFIIRKSINNLKKPVTLAIILLNCTYLLRCAAGSII